MMSDYNSFDEYGFYGENNGPLADPRYNVEPRYYEDPEDIVDKPQHYTRWKIEPITFIMRNGFEFWRGSATKYISRAGYKIYDGKDAVESEITDLEKAKRFCDMRINQLRGEEKL
jgi:hypothetical protein